MIRKKLLNPVLVKLDEISAKLDDVGRNVNTAGTIEVVEEKSILSIEDRYITAAPSVQNQIDIFQGDWISEFPIEGILSGNAAHFTADDRVSRCNGVVPVAGKKILELGPFEAFHSYQLEELGAGSVTSIESNKISFLKCLIVKNVFKLKTEYLHGDFREYLKSCEEKFDIVLASGVLYNMTDPIQLIRDIAGVTDTVFIWTFYYTKERTDIQYMFENTEPILLHSKYKVHKRIYEGRDAKTFSGGEKPYSMWPERETVLEALNDAGFDKINICVDHSLDAGGNHLLLVAEKS